MTTTEKIRKFITTNFYVPNGRTLTDETSLLEEGVIDSTGVLEVLAFIEREFGIKAADEEILPENFDGIGRIARFVEQKIAASAATA